MERCAGGMWKTWDFYALVSAIIGMGQGIYCAFSLINVVKRSACQCAPRMLSPPHADLHKLEGNTQMHKKHMYEQIIIACLLICRHKHKHATNQLIANVNQIRSVFITFISWKGFQKRKFKWEYLLLKRSKRLTKQGRQQETKLLYEKRSFWLYYCLKNSWIQEKQYKKIHYINQKH